MRLPNPLWQWDKGNREIAALAGVRFAASIVGRFAPAPAVEQYVDTVARGERWAEFSYNWLSVVLWFVPWAIQWWLRDAIWPTFAYLVYTLLYFIWGAPWMWRGKYQWILQLHSEELTRLCAASQLTQEQLNAAANANAWADIFPIDDDRRT